MTDDESDRCPDCRADFNYVVNGETYSRCIGVNIRGAYDGILFWQCPDCGHRWHRWPEGTYQRKRAIPYVEGGKQ